MTQLEGGGERMFGITKFTKGNANRQCDCVGRGSEERDGFSSLVDGSSFVCLARVRIYVCPRCGRKRIEKNRDERGTVTL